MKPDLRRIETTLHQISERIPVNEEERSTSEENQTDLHAHLSPMPPASECSEANAPNGSPFFSLSVQTFPAKKHESKTPVLPKLKPPSFSNHRNAPNPALAMSLLQEIEAIVAGWQNELQQVVRQIQDVYLEGPIIDGWLESHSREPEVESGTLRPTKIDRLMDYVEEAGQTDAKVTCQSPRNGYSLCGLDADGQSWSRPCPPEQVASVSVAIARYQKLRLLLNRKQHLETRLCQLAETLVVLHSHISE